MTVPTLRPLGFGEILDGAFTLYRRNLGPFVVTSLVPTLAIVVAVLLLGVGTFGAIATGDPTAGIAAFMGSFALFMFIVALATLVTWAALTREASQAYTGGEVSVGDGMRAGFRAFLPLLAAGILAFIGIVIVVIGVAIAGGMLMGMAAAAGSVLLTVVATIVMFLLMMGAYLCCFALLFAVVPAVVVEGKGPYEALERSVQLARGALPRIIGLMFVTLLIVYLPMIAVLIVTGSTAQFTSPTPVQPSLGALIAQQVLTWGVSVLTVPFMVAVVVLQYYDRRVRTEALDVQMAADALAVAG